MSWSFDAQILIVTILRQLFEVPFFRRWRSQEDRKDEIIYHGSWRSTIPEIVSAVAKVLNTPL
jgi:hypothetical protein